MASFGRTFTLFPLAALLLSTLMVEADLAPSPAPSPFSYISSPPEEIQVQLQASLQSTDAQFQASLHSTNVLPNDAQFQASLQSTDVLPNDIKSQMTKVIEGRMQMTVQKIEEFSQTLKKRLDDPETSTATKECIQQCDEVYESAKDDVKNSLEDIQGGDLFKANFDINAISTNVDTCQQCFEEMVGEDPEITKFDAWVRGVTDDCLGALDKVLT